MQNGITAHNGVAVDDDTPVENGTKLYNATMMTTMTAWKKAASEDLTPPSPREAHRVPMASILNAFRVYEVARETPLDVAHSLSAQVGNTVLLKREDTQPVFSFKLRGAYNKIASLTSEEKRNGVVTCSAGNHAQGVAFAARHLGLSSKIYMPKIAPDVKVQNVRRLGGEAVLYGATFDEASAKSMEVAKEENRTHIHPFNDVTVMAGQGTIAMEILRQHRTDIHAIFVPVGGGGLISGVGSAIKHLVPEVKIIGVEPVDAAGMTESLKAGRPVVLPTVGAFADGVAVKAVGDKTFDICYNGGVVDEMVLCTTDEISAAIKDGFNDLRVIMEPSGSLAIAGLKKYAAMKGLKNETLIAICSGANMDFDRLRFVSERADHSEHLLSLVIPEEKGAFRKVYDIIHPRKMTEVSYRLSDIPLERRKSINGMSGQDAIKRGKARAHIMLSYKPMSLQDADETEQRLRQAGYIVDNLEDNELAKDHCRYLCGGRSFVAENERILRFEFPEKPQALKSFLDSLSNEWNISLMHYRNHGSDVGRVLLGIQVPPNTTDEFEEFCSNMRKRQFPFIEETENPVFKQFLTASDRH